MSVAPLPTASPFVNLQMESEFVRACLQKTGFAQRLLPRIPEEIFTNEIHSWIVSRIKFLMNQSRGKLARVPVEVLKHLTSSIDDEDKRAIFVQTIDTLYKKPVEYEEFAESVVREYASYQSLTSGIREALSQYKRQNDVGRALTTVEDSLRKSRAILSDAEVYDYVGNWKERESARQFNSEIAINNICVKMGIPKIDEQIKLVPGTVTGFVAPFKRFKSVFLNHTGAAALMQGVGVLHVTLENSLDLTNSRYDSWFSGLDMKKVAGEGRTDQDHQRMEAIGARLSNWPQRLKIFVGTASKTSVADIASELDHMETEGFVPEMVVIDYANILAPSTDMGKKPDHEIQTSIVWDMQTMLAKRGKIVVTAFQSKAEGIKVERLDSSHMGKSIGISQALHAALAIDQNENEKAIGICTLSPLFIRNGPIITDHVTLDSDMSRMSVDKGASINLWQEVLQWETDA